MSKLNRNWLLCLIFLSSFGVFQTEAQELDFNQAAATSEAELSKTMPSLARDIIAVYKDEDRRRYLDNLFRLQMIAGQCTEAKATIMSLRDILKENDSLRANSTYVYEIFCNAKLAQADQNNAFDAAFRQSFRDAYSKLGDKDAYQVSYNFVYDLTRGRNDLQRTLQQVKDKNRIDLKDAIGLARIYLPYHTFQSISSLTDPLLREEENRRYIIQDDVLIKTKEGATLSAIVVRKKGVTTPQPTAMIFNIYTNLSLNYAKQAAAYGYVGVTAETRGKRLSPDEIVPYEHEAKDIYGVIDWISKQPWSNGQVGMYGGSYGGFACWAATKYLHPALKTIVPYVANNPGDGLPMENNIFLFVNYAWAFYVTNNKYLDEKTYFDRERWQSLNDKWYQSGKSYRQIDSVDGTPNKWLQRWLQHPSYDEYWQAMLPYKDEFAKINILS